MVGHQEKLLVAVEVRQAGAGIYGGVMVKGTGLDVG